MAIAVIIGYIVVLTLTLAWASKSSGAGRSTMPAASRPLAPERSERCADSRRAITYYHRRYHQHVAAMERVERHLRHDAGRACNWSRHLAERWQKRAGRARVALKAWRHYHFAWRDWLPANWRRLGACETGYGREPGDWTWDSGSYVSAFGIYRPGYADDAHRIGNLSWDETKAKLDRLPTPREQYEAGLSHLRTHGDGWGCPGP